MNEWSFFSRIFGEILDHCKNLLNNFWRYTCSNHWLRSWRATKRIPWNPVELNWRLPWSILANPWENSWRSFRSIFCRCRLDSFWLISWRNAEQESRGIHKKNNRIFGEKPTKINGSITYRDIIYWILDEHVYVGRFPNLGG